MTALQPMAPGLPLLLAIATFVAALAVDAFASRRSVLMTAIGGLAITAIAGAIVAQMATTIVFGVATGGGTTAALTALIATLTALAIVGGRARIIASPGSGRVAVLLTGGAAAAALAVAAKDLLLVVIGLETLALAGYALISSAGTPRSDTAATTYFVQGALAAGLLLFGTAGVAAITRNTLIPGLAANFQQPGNAAITSLVLIFAALVFKAGGFPLHSWVPDAYENAEPAPAAYLAAVPKLAALVVLGTLMLGLGASSRLIPVAAAVAAASVAFGTIAGLRQTSYRRMLGYSSIAQTGFAMTALTAGTAALPAVTLMAVVYSIATFGAFMMAEALSSTGWDGSIAGLAGTGRARPLLAVSTTVCILSLTGIPLTAGFWGKFLSFSTATAAGYTWLAAIGVIGSVISFGYYGSVLRALWLDDAPDSVEAAAASAWGSDADVAPGAESPDTTTVATGVVAVAAIAVLVVGIVPFIVGSGFFAFLSR